MGLRGRGSAGTTAGMGLEEAMQGVGSLRKGSHPAHFLADKMRQGGGGCRI